jgi:hypothetical protein
MPDMARTDPHNITRNWWDRHISGRSLMCADFTTKEYPTHTHEAFVVAVTVGGGSVIKSRVAAEQADTSRSGWV